MDDDGLIQIDRNKVQPQARSLGFSGSEPYFYKHKPFSLRNSASGVTQTGPSTDESKATSGSQNLKHSPPYDPLDKWTSSRRSQNLSSRRSDDGRDQYDSSSLAGYLPDSHERKRKSRDRSVNSRRHHFSNTGHHVMSSANLGLESSAAQDQSQSSISFGIGFLSMVGETLLSHPCIVLRCQCQIRSDSHQYHLTPFTVLPVAYNLCKLQGVACMWKGVASVFVVRGIQQATENLVSEITNWPREVTRHSSTKKMLQHLCLKAVTYGLVTPFYAASLVETVQSDLASDTPGLLDCLREGASRCLVMTSSVSASGLLPLWKLLPACAAVGVCGYAVRCLSSYAVLRSVESDSALRHDRSSGLAVGLADSVYLQLFSGFAASLLSDTLLYPIETLTNRLCVQGTHALIDNTDTGVGVVSLSSCAYSGPIDALMAACGNESPIGLYKGFGALVLQYSAHICLLRLLRMSCHWLADAWPAKGGERGGGGGGRERRVEACETESTVSYSTPVSDGDESPAADSC